MAYMDQLIQSPDRSVHCAGRRKHPTLKAAKAAAENWIAGGGRRWQRRDGPLLVPFRCPVCRKWHTAPPTTVAEV